MEYNRLGLGSMAQVHRGVGDIYECMYVWSVRVWRKKWIPANVAPNPSPINVTG